jgi:hypothetical protein
MAILTAGSRTVAATATLPCMSLYSTAAQNFSLLECGITNTTATAVVVGICRLTTAGTVGAGLTEANLDENVTTAALCTAYLAHTSTGPTLVDLGHRFTLGAAVGAGVIWTWLPGELKSLIGTGHGIGIWCPTGTGQALDAYFKWLE